MRAVRRRRRPRSFRRLGDPFAAGGDDPLGGVANLFDVAMVFAVALLFAFVSYSGIGDLLSRDTELTILKNPGRKDMEVIRRKGVEIEHYRLSMQTLGGAGKRLGVAYRLATGQVIYVPDRPK